MRRFLFITILSAVGILFSCNSMSEMRDQQVDDPSNWTDDIHIDDSLNSFPVVVSGETYQSYLDYLQDVCPYASTAEIVQTLLNYDNFWHLGGSYGHVLDIIYDSCTTPDTCFCFEEMAEFVWLVAH